LVSEVGIHDCRLRHVCPSSISSGKGYLQLFAFTKNTRVTSLRNYDGIIQTSGTPATIAGMITWLAGDAGKDVNGAVIPVYGSDV